MPDPDASGGTLTVTPLPPTARFSLRMPSATLAAVQGATGFTFGVPINRFTRQGECVCARLGPDEWRLLGPEAESEEIARQLEMALAGRGSLVDIGHRDLGFRVQGRDATDVLSAGCPLDFADNLLCVGAATRTRFGKAEIVLLRTVEHCFHIECGRSFGPYVRAFLDDAAREFPGGARSIG